MFDLGLSLLDVYMSWLCRSRSEGGVLFLKLTGWELGTLYCIYRVTLKILQSSHSSATSCIMVNVSMWCLPTTAHKEWCARYYYRNDKESYTFQRQIPFISQHDVHTNIPETNQLSFSINQRRGFFFMN